MSRLIAAALCAVLAAASVEARGAPERPALDTQATIPMTVLTVPADKLPAGCRLQPVDPNATGAARFAMGRVHETNPWVMRPPQPVARVRQMIEPRDYITDKYGGLTGPALHAQLEIGVAEAYGARYLAADGSEIDVWAVRYTDPKLTAPALLMRLDGTQARRFVVGAIAAVVLRSVNDWRTASASGEACAEAVLNHIAALGKQAFAG